MNIYINRLFREAEKTNFQEKSNVTEHNYIIVALYWSVSSDT